MRDHRTSSHRAVARSSIDPDDYLGITLTDEEPALDALARIRSTYSRVLSVDFDNSRTRVASAQSSLSHEIESFDPFELFGRFYHEQNGAELTDKQRDLVRSMLQTAHVMEGGAR